MPVDKSSGLLCDQIVVAKGFYTKQAYPEKIRRIKYFDEQNKKNLVFLTNHFSASALTVAE